MTTESPYTSNLKDFRYIGDSKVEAVKSASEVDRDWLSASPVCELLAQYHILHAGVMHAESPFEIYRANQSGTFMIACFEGEGRVWADGRWIKIRKGEACILPPFVTNAMKCVPGKKWSFSWVRYVESRDSTPIVTEVSPVRGEYQPEPLRAAIRGVIAESMGKAVPASQHHWVELIHHYVLRFAQPHQSDERLWKLWKMVEKNLNHDWSLARLAENACMSEEHLRRLCKQQLGRSPVQHMTYLRMKAASELLSTTDEKVEVIAHEVGYTNGANFSNAFSKWVGVRPMVYREGKKN